MNTEELKVSTLIEIDRFIAEHLPGYCLSRVYTLHGDVKSIEVWKVFGDSQNEVRETIEANHVQMIRVSFGKAKGDEGCRSDLRKGDERVNVEGNDISSSDVGKSVFVVSENLPSVEVGDLVECELELTEVNEAVQLSEKGCIV